MKKTFNKNISFVIVLLFTFSSCYNPRTGCLDSNAANYDVTADEPCDLCCELPQFNLNFLYQVDSSSLDTAIYYKNNVGFGYKVLDFFLLFNDINISGLSENHQVINVDQDVLYGDISLTSLASKNTNVGSILLIDTLIGLDLKLGIPATIGDVSGPYNDYPELEYLFEEEERSEDGSFYMAGIDFVMDSISTDTLRYRFEQFSDEDAAQFFFLDSIIVNKGGGLIVTLPLDFNVLFRDIVVEDTIEAELFKQKMSNNFKFALGSN